MSSQEKLIKEIKLLSDSIRRKNRALRLGISERDKYLETTFKPVIEPLKEVSLKLGKNITEGDVILPVSKSELKTEVDSEKEEEIQDEPGMAEQSTDKSVEQEEEEEEEEEEGLSESDPSNISKLGIDIKFKGDLGRKYLLKMLQSSIPRRKYHVYGARLEGNGLMIGDSTLDVDERDNIIISNKQYKGTIGLFELIFKNIPDKYTFRDLTTFKIICARTNCHRKNYLPTSPIHRNRSVKYQKVISKLFPTKVEKAKLEKAKQKKRYMSNEDIIPQRKIRRTKEPLPSGKGLMKNNYSTNIIYYSDVNKLVNRMRLIHEAIEAGHTGLQNEWVALVDELISRGVITQ
jgi:hypothetical protein